MKKYLLITAIIMSCLVAAAFIYELAQDVAAPFAEEAGQEGKEVSLAENEGTVRVLFIGNSYLNRYNMTRTFESVCRQNGLDVESRLFAFDGAYLRDFLNMKHVLGTLRKGRYDIVIFQEESHCVRDDTAATAAVICEMIRGAAPETRFFLYETMSYKGKMEEQELFTRAYEQISKITGAQVLPVGRDFWEYSAAHPGLKMFDDGQHPSVTGYNVIAQSFFEHLKEPISEIIAKKQKVS